MAGTCCSKSATKSFAKHCLLCHIHRFGYVHRDVKLHNILYGVDKKSRDLYQLASFGLVAHRNNPIDKAGAWAFQAPEVELSDLTKGTAMDIWSLGVTMALLFTPSWDLSNFTSTTELWIGVGR